MAEEIRRTDDDLAPDNDDLNLTDYEKKLLKKLLANMLQFPKEFLTWLPDYVASNVPEIPISQISGFTGFTGQVATRIATNQATTSTAYTDLATVGPQITGLADGTYIFWFGAVQNGTTNVCFMGLNTNGSNPADDTQSIRFNTASGDGGSTAISVTLSNNNNNTVKAVYRTTAGTPQFQDRWLVGLKVANA